MTSTEGGTTMGNPDGERNVMDLQQYVGRRVELHPGLDAWMQGDRYGEVVKFGRLYLTVKMDVSGRALRIPPDRLKLAGERW